MYTLTLVVLILILGIALDLNQSYAIKRQRKALKQGEMLDPSMMKAVQIARICRLATMVVLELGVGVLVILNLPLTTISFLIGLLVIWFSYDTIAKFFFKVVATIYIYKIKRAELKQDLKQDKNDAANNKDSQDK